RSRREKRERRPRRRRLRIIGRLPSAGVHGGEGLRRGRRPVQPRPPVIPRLAVSLILAIAMGVVLTSEVVLTGVKGRRYSLVLAGSLAVGFGFGIAACAFFLWAVLLGPDHRGLALFEVALLVGLIAARLYTWRADHRDRWSPRLGSGAPALSWRFRAGLSFSLVVSALLF